MSTSPYRIYPCGDHAVTIELGATIDAAINEKVLAIFRQLKEGKLNGVLDIIPSYLTVTIVYDVVFLKKIYPDISIYEMMCCQLQKAVDSYRISVETELRVINIPACYDPLLAPDIVSLAALHQLSVEEVIQLHTAATYRVYMIGFLPGFAYMGTVDEKIATPRKEKPRTKVPAGSIGIAGSQTGIYPFDSPGGWQLIGQTPLPMFIVSSEEPCYLQPGDSVRFYAIPLHEFKKLQNT